MVKLISRRFARLAIAVGLLCVGCVAAVAAPTSAQAATPVTGPQIISNAQTWLSPQVPYNQNATHNGYREDCSGYVSMALGLPAPGPTTVTLVNYAHQITQDQLSPGDLLLNSAAGDAGHVVIFASWANASHTSYNGYEEDPYWGGAHYTTSITYPYWSGNGTFLPYRANNYSDGSFAGYESAFQANTGSVYMQGDLGEGSLQLGMAPNTSPGLSILSNGQYEGAFQANTGNMYLYGSSYNGDSHLGMAPGTSPSVAASPSGGFYVALQANTGELYTYSSSSGAYDTRLGMAGGTSPAIAALSTGGYELAFQANTGDLWVTGALGTRDTGEGMKAGTSPSIAASPSGGFMVAFQANTGSMYTYDSSLGAIDRNLGMDNQTSPSIAALAGNGYEMAFQANTDNLYVFGDAGRGDTGEGMKSGTSPSIAASPAGGFEAAFQANTGDEYRYLSNGTSADLKLGMDNFTSPCVSSALGGGCAPSAPPSPSTISTTRVAGGVDGKPLADSLHAAGGSDPYTWSILNGTLPRGLSLSGDGHITGIPRSAGTRSFTVCITDSLEGRWSDTKSLKITVVPIAVRTKTLPGGRPGRTYKTTLAAWGGTQPLTWKISSGRLPSGLALSKSGAISGRPTRAGTMSFTVEVIDARKHTATRRLSIRVA